MTLKDSSQNWLSKYTQSSQAKNTNWLKRSYFSVLILWTLTLSLMIRGIYKELNQIHRLQKLSTRQKQNFTATANYQPVSNLHGTYWPRTNTTESSFSVSSNSPSTTYTTGWTAQYSLPVTNQQWTSGKRSPCLENKKGVCLRQMLGQLGLISPLPIISSTSIFPFLTVRWISAISALLVLAVILIVLL